MKKKIEISLMVLLTLALGGCARPFTVPEPGSDYALIGDHSADVATGEFDYTLLEMDGHPVKKETVPFGVDMNARTIANAGPHTFKVLVELHSRHGTNPHEANFAADVKGGTTYFVGTRDGLPVLLEYSKVGVKKEPNKTSEPTAPSGRGAP